MTVYSEGTTPLPVVQSAYYKLALEPGDSEAAEEQRSDDRWGNQWRFLTAQYMSDPWGYNPTYLEDFVVFVSGTSSRSALGLLPSLCVLAEPPTHSTMCRVVQASSTPIQEGMSASEMVYELRRVCGLSWEITAQLMGVSRRAIHNWASGEEINDKNYERLGKLLSIVRKIDRGSADENRALFLAPTRDGDTLHEILSRQDFERALTLVGGGRGRSAVNWTGADLDNLSAYGPLPISRSVGIQDENYGDEPDIRVLTKPKYRRTKIKRRRQ